MSSTSTSNFDFYFFTMQLMMDTYRILLVPIVTQKAGFTDFTVAYAVIMVLFGLPAIMDATTYMMISPTSMSERDRRWFRGYQAIALIQINMNALVSVYVTLSPAIEHVYNFFNNRNDLIKLYSPSCSIKWDDKYTADRSSAESDLLQPSCSIMSTSRKACELQALFSFPRRIQLYTAITISMLMFLYMLMFGRSWSTYCWISRLYLSFVVLYIVNLLLHFFNASNMAKLFQYDRNLKTQLNENYGISYILHMVPACLSLCSFFHVAIGYKAGDSAKRNFIVQWSAVCLTNFVFVALLSIINILQKTTIMALCNFNISDLMAYTSLPGDVRVVRRRSSVDNMTRSQSFVLAEAIAMLRETSGYTPWATFLPHEILMIVFALMNMCQYFVICDIYASIVFKADSPYVFVISVLRFGFMIVLELITTDGLPKGFDELILIFISVTFQLLRMVHCIMIHFGTGFPVHLRSRRQLISEKSRVQLFVYDWYIAPGIAYLFNFGYPLMFILDLLYHKKHLFSVETGLFYFIGQVLPSVICMVVSYCIPLTASK